LAIGVERIPAGIRVPSAMPRMVRVHQRFPRPRLDDVPAGGSSETSCDVKVMVARWPSKSIILWTNAGASLQSGTRPQDKVGARRDCLEASAGQLAEDLGKFFKGQGG